MKRIIVTIALSVIALMSVLAFSGCEHSRSNMQIVAAALSGLDSAEFLEMTIEAEVKYENLSERIDGYVAFSSSQNEQRGYYCVGDIYSYYVNGYSYKHEDVNNEYIEHEDFADENLNAGINIAELEKLKPDVIKHNNYLYEVKIEKADLDKVVDFDVEDIIFGFGDMIIVVQLDNKGFLKKMECTAGFKVEDMDFSLLIELEVLSTNNVVVEIPEYVIKSIESYKLNAENLIFTTREDSSIITGLTQYGKTLEHIEIPYTLNGKPVTYLGKDAFFGSNLKSVVIPDSVTHIYSAAFSGCSVQSIVMSSRIEYISENALSFYFRMKLIMAGTTPPAISANIFGYFPSERVLAIIVPPSALEDYKTAAGWSLFADKIFAEGSVIPDHLIENNVLVSYWGDKEEFIIPSGVTSIAGGALSKSINLKTVYIPNTVTSIGGNGNYSVFGGLQIENIIFEENSRLEIIDDGAFMSSQAITSISLPESLRHIGKSAFAGCFYLEEIYIPAGVLSIGQNAFMNCYAAVYMMGEIPPEIDGDAFGVPVEGFYMGGPMQIFVPASALAAYQIAWPRYASILIGY